MSKGRFRRVWQREIVIWRGEKYKMIFWFWTTYFHIHILPRVRLRERKELWVSKCERGWKRNLKQRKTPLVKKMLCRAEIKELREMVLYTNRDWNARYRGRLETAESGESGLVPWKQKGLFKPQRLPSAISAGTWSHLSGLRWKAHGDCTYTRFGLAVPTRTDTMCSATFVSSRFNAQSLARSTSFQ